MTCTASLRATRPAAAALVAAAALATAIPATAARAQTNPVPTSPALPPPQVAPYRAPVLALVQPAPAGGALTVPQDRPVVVFRFAQGEELDPIDGASFRVAVDGHDRTAQFHVAAAEAWGPLGDAAGSGTAAGVVAAGAHQVAARVCSSRGACAAVDVTVTAVPAATADAVAAGSSGKTSRKARVFDLVLGAARRLLAP